MHLPLPNRTSDGHRFQLVRYEREGDRFVVVDETGTLHFYYSTERIAKMDRMAERIVVGMPCVLGILDKLRDDPKMPHLDVDAILSSCMHGLERLTSNSHVDRERAAAAVIETVMDGHAMAFIENPLARHHLEYGLRAALSAAQSILSYHNLYTGEVMLYDYEKRRGKEAVVLVRKRYAAFD